VGDKVFVNGRSAIHAGSAGQSTAFPDVNLCPPTPPAGPVPIPLPNVARGADLQGGASSVLIEGNPMAKKSSFLGKSTGNEVAQSTGGGVVSHVVQGKAYFVSYSMDVTIEGEEVPRHLDMLTHNHAAQSPANAAMGTYLGVMDPGAIPPVQQARKAVKENRSASYEMFLTAAPARADDHVDSYELTSHDGRYKTVVAASAGQRTGALTSVKFKNLLRGKSYSLFRLVGGEPSHRIALFERVSYATLLQERPAPPAPPAPATRPQAAPPPPEPPKISTDPLLQGEPIDPGEGWYWAHHHDDDDET
jgi:hypothetical protein